MQNLLNKVTCGDSVELLQQLPPESVHMVVTSPPYFGLRDYEIPGRLWGGDPDCAHEWIDQKGVDAGTRHGKGTQSTLNGGRSTYKYVEDHNYLGGAACTKCNAWCGPIGSEPSPDLYIQHTVEFFREVRRVLRSDGTVWINIGDSYSSQGGSRTYGSSDGHTRRGDAPHNRVSGGDLKPKDLCLIPHRVAIALQADGWWIRQDIVWCLSGGTKVYAKTQKRAMPTTIREISRLDPRTVKLWNGERWTQLLGMSKSDRTGPAIELVLRSGERISCTPAHRFPTVRGLLKAGDIVLGDIIESTTLPEPDTVRDCILDEDAAWFAGLYIAEGSHSEDTIQISGPAGGVERLERLRRIAHKYGGSLAVTETDNTQHIRMYGKILNALLGELVTGKVAINKGFAPVVWEYSNSFLESMVEGYLVGDGHWDAKNNRWRLGFCRNYNLERDLRTACARLGYTLTLNLSTVKYNGELRPTFRGELRKVQTNHHSTKSRCEVVKIRKARCKYVYDIGVADDPHLFALASGILTHNSKINPMPGSQKDRPTTAHEYVFLLAKNAASPVYWVHRDGQGTREKPKPEYRWLDRSTGEELKQQPEGDWKTEQIECPHCEDAIDQCGECGGEGTIKRWKRTNLWKGHDYYYDHVAVQEAAVRPGEITTLYGEKGRHVVLKPGDPNYRGGHEQYGRILPGSSTRNLRSVWSIATQPQKASHFAVFPEKLVEPCIKAGTSEKGCCPKCGAGWVRVVDKETRFESGSGKVGRSSADVNSTGKWAGIQHGTNLKLGPVVETTTTGWQPSCDCNAGKPIPAIVLDPFGGSGRAGVVAKKLGRSYILFDIKPEYCDIAEEALSGVPEPVKSLLDL